MPCADIVIIIVSHKEAVLKTQSLTLTIRKVKAHLFVVKICNGLFCIFQFTNVVAFTQVLARFRPRTMALSGMFYVADLMKQRILCNDSFER